MSNTLPIALTRLLESISAINSSLKLFDPYDHYAVCWVTLIVIDIESDSLRGGGGRHLPGHSGHALLHQEPGEEHPAEVVFCTGTRTEFNTFHTIYIVI